MMETQKFVYIKRRIEVNDYLRNFIFFNINYRRKIWNLFVEEYKNCNGDWNKFNPNEIASRLTYSIDKETKETSEYYTVDIIKSVRRDVLDAFNKVKKRTINEHRYSSLQFKSYDRYKGSFRVRTANELNNKNIFRGKVHIKDNYNFEFRAHKHNHFNISLKESLYDEYIDNSYCILDKDKNLKCYFHDEDIKDIVFSHEMGKFYISLSIQMTYIIDKKEVKNRKKLAGIDLGIHNPITLYDGCNSFIIRMSDNELNKIHYLERRIGRLQHIMDKKEYMSNNYEKVRYKYRRTWKRIYDIRCNWRRQTANVLSNKYKTLVVDKFKQPDWISHKDIPNTLKRRYNHFNREHGMSLFAETLIHDCIKNGCEFIEAPSKTTRTCSCCGYVNPKLELSQRVLKCENCKNELDRDINAAINCYDFYKNR